MMKHSVFTILILALSCLSFAWINVNYEHKAIQKTLVKNCKLVNPKVQEMHLSKELNAGIEGKFFNIESETDSEITHMYVGRVNSCRAGGCSIPNPLSQGNSEYFDYLVLFNIHCEVVFVKIYNYQATHGHEVTAKGWLKQFIGYDANDKTLEVGKNIDSISGATISVNGITRDIQEKTHLLQKIVKQQNKPIASL